MIKQTKATLVAAVPSLTLIRLHCWFSKTAAVPHQVRKVWCYGKSNRISELISSLFLSWLITIALVWWKSPWWIATLEGNFQLFLASWALTLFSLSLEFDFSTFSGNWCFVCAQKTNLMKLGTQEAGHNTIMSPKFGWFWSHGPRYKRTLPLFLFPHPVVLVSADWSLVVIK